MSIIYFSWTAFHYTKCFYLIKSCLINWKQLLFYLFLLLSGKCQWPPCGNQSGQQNKIMLFSGLFFESVFFNLLSSYGFMMIQQTISQQCFLCWEKRELFLYPAMFPHLPEHLASRYVILYACVPMILDFNGPIIIQFKSMSLKQKQTA